MIPYVLNILSPSRKLMLYIVDLFQLSGQQVYLVSATPDAEFSATDTYFLDFNVSCGEAVVYEQSQTFIDG